MQLLNAFHSSHIYTHTTTSPNEFLIYGPKKWDEQYDKIKDTRQQVKPEILLGIVE